MSVQTFQQYSAQKKRDLKKLQVFFPEYFSGNPDMLDVELQYSDHMNEVKTKLEQIFGRKLQWREVDVYSMDFMKVAFLKINKELVDGKRQPPTNFEEAIDLDISVRKIFCEILQVKMIDVDVYRQACVVSRTGVITQING